MFVPRRFREYRKTDLNRDLIAGLTTAVMLVPQAMAYAVLAGLPAYVGLHAAILPPIIYALLGTSRSLALGPTALDSLLTAGAIGALALSGTEDYLILSAALAVIVGIVHLLAGALKLGRVAQLLSRPVVNGFVAAGALIIGINQLRLLLGVSLPRTVHVEKILLTLFERFDVIDPATVSIGSGAVLVLIFLKRWRPSFPRALLVVVVSTLVVLTLGLNVDQIGFVPKGLPMLGLPSVGREQILDLLPAALVLALVAVMEAISVGRRLKRPEDPEIRPNRELVALGMSNVAAGLSHGLPVSAGFSRTAVADAAGAQTPFYGVVTGIFLGLTVLFLGPILEPVPMAVLGAIIITAAFGLIDPLEPLRLYRLDRVDFIIYAVTLLATLTLGIQQGVGIGVLLALVFALRFKKLKVETTRLESTGQLRLDGSVNYLNVERIRGIIESAPGPITLVGEPQMDATAHARLAPYLKIETDPRP